MRGYRNTSILVCFLGLCAWLAWLNPESIPQMGGTFGALGVSTGLGVAARAGNKWAEAKGGEIQ